MPSQTAQRRTERRKSRQARLADRQTRRRDRRRRGVRVREPSRQENPDRAERAYEAALISMVDSLVAFALRSLTARVKALEPERADASDSRINAILVALRRKSGQIFTLRRMQALAEEMIGEVNDHNRDQIKRQLLQSIGVDISPEVSEAIISGAVERNVALIKSIPQKLLGQVEEVLEAGVLRGARAETLAGELEERLGVARSRARLIARDQVNKFNGELAAQRQAAVGVTQYRWSTSRDERVRDTHAANEGQVFSWSSPPATGHPGEEINCRCVPIPVFSDISI